MEQARSASGLSSFAFEPTKAESRGYKRHFAQSDCWSPEPFYGNSIGNIKLGHPNINKGYLRIKQGCPHINQGYPIIRATATFDFKSASLDIATPTFPSFLPPQVCHLRDSAARAIALRIRRLPVQTTLAENPIMTSCVKPTVFNKDLPPVFLL
eukprot:c40483_g1_i1 orf=1-459(-)